MTPCPARPPRVTFHLFHERLDADPTGGRKNSVDFRRRSARGRHVVRPRRSSPPPVTRSPTALSSRKAARRCPCRARPSTDDRLVSAAAWACRDAHDHRPKIRMRRSSVIVMKGQPLDREAARTTHAHAALHAGRATMPRVGRPEPGPNHRRSRSASASASRHGPPRGRRSAATAPGRTRRSEGARHLRSRAITLAGHRDHITAELLRMRNRHGADPSSEAAASHTRSQPTGAGPVTPGFRRVP